MNSTPRGTAARALLALTAIVLATVGLGLASAAGQTSGLPALPTGTTGPGPEQPGKPPKLSIKGATVKEGDRAESKVKLALTVSGKADDPISARYKLVAGSAKPNRDFTDRGGEIALRSGARKGTLAVEIRGDRKREAKREGFDVKLVKAKGAKIARDTARVTIVDDD